MKTMATEMLRKVVYVTLLIMRSSTHNDHWPHPLCCRFQSMQLCTWHHHL